MAEQYQLSLGSVQRCINYLADLGLVVKSHGSGVYVGSPELIRFGHGSIKVAINLEVNPESRRSYCGQVLVGVQEVAAKEGCLLEIDYRDSLAQTVPSVFSNIENYHALLLLGASFDDVFPAKKVSCPVVGVEMGDHHHGTVSLLSLDPFQAADIAVEYFRGLGLKHAVILTPRDFSHIERAEIFRYRWDRTGSSEWHFWPEEANFPLRPDHAYYICSGDNYEVLGFQLNTKLRRYPNIISLDGKSLLVKGREPGIVITPDWVEVGRAAMNEVLRRIRYPDCGPQRIYSSCRILFPETRSPKP